MGKEHIDASVGLRFSLTLFERYRKNGVLRAELQHVPGIRGRCKGYIQLVEGKVTSSYVEDREGRRHSISATILAAVDDERGPFDWQLAPLPAPPSTAKAVHTFEHATYNTPVPKVIAALDLELLRGWSAKQKLMLSTVYEVIDGRKDIESLKKEVPLQANITEEALRVLLSLGVIAIN